MAIKGCGDGHILCLDCISVSALFVILYNSFSRSHCWEEMGRGYTGCLLFFTTACESTITSK